MPTDMMHMGLGFEVASLRALGEVRRRQSLADRLLRERRQTSTTSEQVQGRQTRPDVPLVPVSGNEPKLP